MRLLQRIRLRLRAIFRRPQLERELDLELADHLAFETEALIAAGHNPEEARRRALATMGRTDRIREECRDSRGTVTWENLKLDVHFGLRMLRKNRTFSVLALATIALGIGSTTAIVSLIDAILIRPLPFPAPDRLFQAEEVGMRGPLDVLRANARLAEYAGHLGLRDFTLATPGRPERRKGSEVSANFFQVLAAPPLLGRTSQQGEDRPGRLRVAVLSHAFWIRHFARNPAIVGQHFILDESPYEIIGVMPPSFQFPAPDANFWVPMRLDPRNIGEYWGGGGVATFARLAPGQTRDAADAELRAAVPGIRASFPWRMPDAWATGATLTPLQDYLTGSVKTKSLLLLAVVALVLLIAVVNVANLLIAQAASRHREFSLRASLGATTARIARQLLTEGMLLAIAGGFLGLLLASGQLTLLKHLLPPDTPRLAEAALDTRVLAFSASITLLSGLLFGLWPAWRSRRPRPGATLILAEATFATVLLITSGLLLRSLWSVLQIDPGFQVQSIVTAEFSPNRVIAASREKTAAIADQIQAKLLAYPGVVNVAAMKVLPVTPEISAFTAAIEDHPRPPQDPQIPLWSTEVTPSHLDTLGIRLLEGRAFTPADRAGAQPVVIVDKRTARRYWPDRSPIGRRLRPVWQNDWRTIVGVVDNVKNFGYAGPPSWVEGEVYLPLPQAIGVPQKLSLVVRIQSDPSNFEKQLPYLVSEICSNCALTNIARMESILHDARRAPRSLAWLVGGFAFLALAMAAAGIYGVVSNSVLRRTREFGVRLALGASPAHLARIVIVSSVAYTAAGAALGLVVSWILAKSIKSLLYGVAEHDPLAFTLAPALLLAVALAATIPPTIRALRIDPAQSLREG
ncbi:MAG: ADOP family duplicated permease [Bryobacteraceae bacterium]